MQARPAPKRALRAEDADDASDVDADDMPMAAEAAPAPEASAGGAAAPAPGPDVAVGEGAVLKGQYNCEWYQIGCHIYETYEDVRDAVGRRR